MIPMQEAWVQPWLGNKDPTDQKVIIKKKRKNKVRVLQNVWQKRKKKKAKVMRNINHRE